MPRKWITGPRLAATLIVLVLIVALWAMLRKPAIEVELATATRGALAVTVDDIGETRVHDLFAVSSPVSGELLRVPFKPGAAVKAGAVLFEVQPVQPDPVDARSYAQASAQVEARQAELSAARNRVQEARAAERLAAADYGRVAALMGSGFVTRARFDEARAQRDQSRAALNEAANAEDAALHGLQAAQALLRSSAGAPSGQVVSVRAPVSGAVMRVLQESRRPVVAGTPVLEVGDPARIEIVADLLSADAVKVRPGAAVEILGWGGDAPLRGTVRLVEPFGFTKISALGVEEQRVNAVIDLAPGQPGAAALGHGYRATVRIAVWSAPDVLRVPLGALFRDAEGWAVFTLDTADKAHKTGVTIGHLGTDQAEVLAGLEPGQRVIVHPGEKVAEGVRVRSLAKQ